MAHDSGQPLFREESSQPKRSGEANLASWKVLVVDDDESVHQISNIVLKNFKFQDRIIQVFDAYSAKEAIELLNEHDDISVGIIDVVMEDPYAGLNLVRHIREHLENQEMQLILRTGQPGYAPELQVVLDYDINDYCNKSELTQTRFVSAVVSALRNYDRVHYAGKLLNQKKLAESLNEAKSLFFAQASHEIRTPISGVIGLCQLLSGTDLSKEQREYVRSIADSGQLLLAVVNDILDLSKIEAGKLVLDEANFRVKDTISSVVRLLQPLCHQHVNLKYSISNSVPDHLFGDAVRINQILNNLIGNAVKFTTSGFIDVRVTAESLPENGCQLNIAVEDTGCGIPRDKLAHLFAAYEQIDSRPGSLSGSGTGLGLMICKHLCELMQGDISVVSQVSKGSTFTVNLILETAREEVSTQESSGLALPGENTFTILIADDNPTNRLITRKMLEKLGFNVLQGSSGKEAIEQMQKQHCDLVLMDCQMPEIDGFAATEVIRKSEQFRHVPIIALSAGNEEKERHRCFLSGMNDFCSKPIDEDKLRHMLSKWLGYRSFM